MAARGRSFGVDVGRCRAYGAERLIPAPADVSGLAVNTEPDRERKVSPSVSTLSVATTPWGPIAAFFECRGARTKSKWRPGGCDEIGPRIAGDPGRDGGADGRTFLITLNPHGQRAR
jgi:hypothetical protein